MTAYDRASMPIKRFLLIATIYFLQARQSSRSIVWVSNSGTVRWPPRKSPERRVLLAR